MIDEVVYLAKFKCDGLNILHFLETSLSTALNNVLHRLGL